MYDLNESIRSLNVGLPDDIARLKAAGYYKEAIARIDRLLAEDWTKTQNGPASNGIAPPERYVPPENPTPRGVDALREALTVQKEIMRRLPGEYCWTEAEAIARIDAHPWPVAWFRPPIDDRKMSAWRHSTPLGMPVVPDV